MGEKKLEKKFDENGNLALRGEKNQIILEQAQELYINRNKKKNYLMIQMISISLLLEG